jgi:hypothetical protein
MQPGFAIFNAASAATPARHGSYTQEVFDTTNAGGIDRR